MQPCRRESQSALRLAPAATGLAVAVAMVRTAWFRRIPFLHLAQRARPGCQVVSADPSFIRCGMRATELERLQQTGVIGTRAAPRMDA